VNRGARILVVDDEPAIRRTLQTNLAARGYEVTAVETGEEALRQVEEIPPDLVLLDLMLPGMSGLDVCGAIRAESSVPILVLSARGEERAKVRALDLGADDYVTKPFGMDELLARTRALLRRAPGTTIEGGILQAGNLSIDLDTRRACRDDTPLDLTARELDVLIFLMRHAGKIVTHRMLLAEVWGPEYGHETQYLRVFVSRLRHKIEDDPVHPTHILTEPGIGYRLQPGN
jgi:two-component system KDP operon response regulator KdpE